MAEDREADSPDESASAARPDVENDQPDLSADDAVDTADDATDEATDEAGDDATDEVVEHASVGGEGAAVAVKKGRTKKDKATPKQHQAVEKRKRTTPVSFIQEAVGELRKVVYPTAPQLGNYFVVVLVFVLIVIGYVSLLDLGFGWVIVKVFS